jgi:murein L,D-transpeptidase YcbB/YkuD
MRLLKILLKGPKNSHQFSWKIRGLILISINFFFFGNVYAMNSNDQKDNYLSTYTLPIVSKDLKGNIGVYADSMIPASPLLTAYKKPYGSKGFIDTVNFNLINIPDQNIKTGSSFHVNDKVLEYLKSRLTPLTIKHIIDSKNNLNCDPDFLFSFYLHRGFKPVWINQDGMNKKAENFIGMLLKAEYEGLDSSIYHRDDILSLLTHIKLNSIYRIFEPEKFAELELLLTDSFFSYGYQLSEGMINPNSYDFDWHIKKSKKDLLKILKALLNHDKLEELVDIMQPNQPGYLRLKSALFKYINIKNSGAWHKITGDSKMRKGNTGKRIAALRSRLIISGDLTDSKSSKPGYFDETLENAVKKFQSRNGLKSDGVVGSNTLSALNVSVEDRIEQIKLNMERWRWLPRDLGERYILVNTANYDLDVIENGKTLESIRVIVGKKKRPTPVLSQKITYLELNPYWNIPFKIALKDILPHIKKDPNYLAEKNIRIFENWTAGAKEIAPDSIDWDTITKKNFVYKLRQDPSNSNALGRIKFIFPNEYSIYLHSTPAHELFSEAKRTFSSGCIRIEKPMELADYLLKDNSKWNPDKLAAAVNSKKTKEIFLSNPIDIHILYWTAWVDKDGVVNFRDDIYGRDHQLYIVLNDKINNREVIHGNKLEKKLLSFHTLH